MKRFLLITGFFIISAAAWSQENMFSVSGGYVFTNMEEVDENAAGWRINGVIEFNPSLGKIAHGFTVGYIQTQATYKVGLQTTDFKYSHLPIYYAPKFLFGKDSFKGFVKGAIGFHFSWFDRTGALGTLESSDAGFYGGAGVGLMKSFGEKFFINAEYEWAYMSNASYRDGFVNSAMGGIGFRF
jgi:hypothetical protein